MSFRSPDNWITLGLTIMAAFALGRRSKWQPFPTMLFLMSAFLAFRARRDVWILVLVAIWIAGEAGRALVSGRSSQLTKGQIATTAALVALVTYYFSLSRQITERSPVAGRKEIPCKRR